MKIHKNVLIETIRKVSSNPILQIRTNCEPVVALAIR